MILTNVHGKENTGHAGCHVAAPHKMALRPLRPLRSIARERKNGRSFVPEVVGDTKVQRMRGMRSRYSSVEN